MIDRLMDEIIGRMRRIAVVGMSRDPAKAAGGTPLQLRGLGYEIVPVNPSTEEISGITAYPCLAAVPGRIDVVNVFRPPMDAADVAREAVEVGAGAIWLQLGIVSDDARATAESAGVAYVEDACLWVEAARRARA
jgi:predicted CoA-binding protein